MKRRVMLLGAGYSIGFFVIGSLIELFGSKDEGGEGEDEHVKGYRERKRDFYIQDHSFDLEKLEITITVVTNTDRKPDLEVGYRVLGPCDVIHRREIVASGMSPGKETFVLPVDPDGLEGRERWPYDVWFLT